jgi:3-hydroxymyristoyl/3-hydroxydecanoyl-(acyl carrier protein) dehydratase
MSRYLQFSEDHPALPGHFPGRPILPGVVLLDHVMLAAGEFLDQRDGGEWRIVQAPTVKFLRPLSPAEAVEMVFEGPAEKLRFRMVLADDPDGVVVSGTLVGTRE